MAAEWVSVVASQLRTMKADLNSLTALNFPFTGDRYERLDPNDGTHTVQWEVLRDDVQALL